MKSVLCSVLVAVLAVACFPHLLLADHHEATEPERSPGYSVIHFDNVDPANAPAHEENAKAWVAAFKESGLGAEYSWRMYSNSSFEYVYISDMPNFAFLDMQAAQETEVADAIGADKLGQLMASGVVSSHYSQIVKQAPELSYMPEGGLGEIGFVHVGVHHVKPSMNEQFKAVAKKAIAARKKTGSTMAVFGSEIQFGQGSYQVVTVAKDAASYYSAPSIGAVLTEAYGAEEAMAMFNDWRNCITDYEISDWQFRPDLSFMPGMESEGQMQGSSE